MCQVQQVQCVHRMETAESVSKSLFWFLSWLLSRNNFTSFSKYGGKLIRTWLFSFGFKFHLSKISWKLMVLQVFQSTPVSVFPRGKWILHIFQPDPKIKFKFKFFMQSSLSVPGSQSTCYKKRFGITAIHQDCIYLYRKGNRVVYAEVKISREMVNK